MSVIKTDPRKNSDTPVLSGLTSHIKNHILKYVGFIIQDVEFTGRIYIIMENESNYELYKKLNPRCFSEAMVARIARTELERRADNGDGEARMLLELQKLEPARKPLYGHVVHSINERPTRKFVYTLRLKRKD